ncbi:MAG: hypothetical protein MK185_15605 [Saccharospirillaceae bacterium]|nr:hypothetical protein [Saccharospirillaceae bacterium]
MLNLYHATIASLALTVSGMAMSATDCGPYKVKHIQVEGAHVLFHPDVSGYSWKTLGVLDVPGTKERLSLLLTAHASRKTVTLRFSDDNYPCADYDLSKPAYMVRINS